MALMLIDTRDRGEPEPEHGRGPLDVDWQLVFWVATTLVLFVGARMVPPLAGVVLAVLGVCATFKILIVVTGGWGHGLGDHRQ